MEKFTWVMRVMVGLDYAYKREADAMSEFSIDKFDWKEEVSSDERVLEVTGVLRLTASARVDNTMCAADRHRAIERTKADLAMVMKNYLYKDVEEALAKLTLYVGINCRCLDLETRTELAKRISAIRALILEK